MPYSAQDMSNYIPEVWSSKTEKIFDKEAVMLKLVSRTLESELSVGDTVHVQRPGDMTVANYSRNTPLTLQQLTVTDDTLVINKQKYIYYGLDKMDIKQSKVPIADKYTERAGVAMALDVDSILLGHYTDALQTIGAAGAGVALTASNIHGYFNDVAENLDNQNIKGERHCVISPKFRKLINLSPEMASRGTKLVDENIQNGYMGKFAGFDVHVSTNMATVSGTVPLMFLTKDFIQYAEQLSVTEFENPTGYFNKAFKMIKLYGSKVFNPECGVTVYANA